MISIRSLQPNVTREEAIAQFCPRGPIGWLQRMGFGRLHSVADFYVPFKLFQVEICNAGLRSTQILGLDAVTGSLDLYRFEQVPDPPSLMSVDTRNCPPVSLTDARAGELLVEKVQRALFSNGFFRIQALRIVVSPLPDHVYVPYWVVFRGHGTRARMSVIDAIRRGFEGVKVRQLLQTWLLERGG